MKRALLLLSLTTALVALPGCARHHHHRTRSVPAPVVIHHGGPPPHAPAHGYRHKHAHRGVELVFDAHLGVYAVVGWDQVYFHREHFYRVLDGSWQKSTHLDQGWAHLHHERLPKGLAKRALRAHRKGRRKGHSPAKHHRH